MSVVCCLLFVDCCLVFGAVWCASFVVVDCCWSLNVVRCVFRVVCCMLVVWGLLFVVSLLSFAKRCLLLVVFLLCVFSRGW